MPGRPGVMPSLMMTRQKLSGPHSDHHSGHGPDLNLMEQGLKL